MAEGSSPEIPQQSETENPNPTKASDSFLKKLGERTRRVLDIATGFPMGAITAGTSAGIVNDLGINPVPDIVEGRWGVLAAKTALAGLTVVSSARFFKGASEAVMKPKI